MSSVRHKSQVRSTIQKRDARGVVRHGAEWLALWSDPESMKSAEEKRRDAEASRRRRDLEESLSAAGRSIAGDPLFRLHWQSPSDEDGRLDIAALRGHADSIALRRRFHSSEMHERLAPADATPRQLFDLCEKVRCEALGTALFAGVRENLIALQKQRLETTGLLHAHLALLVPLREGLEMVVRDVLTDSPVPSIVSPAMCMWDRWIRECFTDLLDRLSAAIRNQADFAAIAISFIRVLLDEVGSDAVSDFRRTPSRDSGDDANAAPERLREDPMGAVVQPAAIEARSDRTAFTDAGTTSTAPYKVFTTAYDRVEQAGDLINDKHLRELRASLESRRGDMRRDLARLTARFQRRLLARMTRDWSFDLDEGVLDASRLDRVIVNPGFASAYKEERESTYPDTAVAVLIDNSGSMRGKPIEISFLAADLICAALDRCSVVSEILGFTTREWKGGQSAKEWVRAGRPPEPGRVNDLLHIVYKSATEPARRARRNLAAMLEPVLLKENIDGEALLWASRRLLIRPEKRKILIVISDGAPVDQFTLEMNRDKQILDRHLRQVVRQIEDAGEIELTAIGVKHDAGQFYRRSVQIQEIGNLGPGLIGLVDRLLV